MPSLLIILESVLENGNHPSAAVRKPDCADARPPILHVCTFHVPYNAMERRSLVLILILSVPTRTRESAKIKQGWKNEGNRGD